MMGGDNDWGRRLGETIGGFEVKLGGFFSENTNFQLFREFFCWRERNKLKVSACLITIECHLFPSADVSRSDHTIVPNFL